jgi:hypothetical protein
MKYKTYKKHFEIMRFGKKKKAFIIYNNIQNDFRPATSNV